MFKTRADIGKEQSENMDLRVNLMFIYSAVLYDLERGFVIEASQGRRKDGRPTRCFLAEYNFGTWKRGETLGKFTAHDNAEAIQRAEAIIAKVVNHE